MDEQLAPLQGAYAWFSHRPGLAVAVALGWFAIFENAVAQLTRDNDRWLPGQASGTLLENEVIRTESAVTALLTLAVWCLVISAVSAWRINNADLR